MYQILNMEHQVLLEDYRKHLEVKIEKILCRVSDCDTRQTFSLPSVSYMTLSKVNTLLSVAMQHLAKNISILYKKVSLPSVHVCRGSTLGNRVPIFAECRHLAKRPLYRVSSLFAECPKFDTQQRVLHSATYLFSVVTLQLLFSYVCSTSGRGWRTIFNLNSRTLQDL